MGKDLAPEELRICPSPMGPPARTMPLAQGESFWKSKILHVAKCPSFAKFGRQCLYWRWNSTVVRKDPARRSGGCEYSFSLSASPSMAAFLDKVARIRAELLGAASDVPPFLEIILIRRLRTRFRLGFRSLRRGRSRRGRLCGRDIASLFHC